MGETGETDMEIVARVADLLNDRNRVEIGASIALLAVFPSVQQTARVQPHHAIHARFVPPLAHDLLDVAPRLLHEVEVQTATFANQRRRFGVEETPPRAAAVDVVEQRLGVEQSPADVQKHADVLGVGGDHELAQLRDRAELLMHHPGEIDAHLAPAVRNLAVAAVLLDREQLQRVDAQIREVVDLVGELAEVVVRVFLSQEGGEEHLVHDGFLEIVERELFRGIGRGDAIDLSWLIEEQTRTQRAKQLRYISLAPIERRGQRRSLAFEMY